MGLDITYVSKARRVACDNSDTCEHVQAFANTDFPDRALPIVDGCYDFDVIGEFRAGSYSGYSAWREQLAALIGRTADEMWFGDGLGDPFYELIDFSDCEGVIGSVVARKLAQDFAAFDDHARATLGEYAYGKYQEWRRAFEVASDDGFVSFH